MLYKLYETFSSEILNGGFQHITWQTGSSKSNWNISHESFDFGARASNGSEPNRHSEFLWNIQWGQQRTDVSMWPPVVLQQAERRETSHREVTTGENFKHPVVPGESGHLQLNIDLLAGEGKQGQEWERENGEREDSFFLATKQRLIDSLSQYPFFLSPLRTKLDSPYPR